METTPVCCAGCGSSNAQKPVTPSGVWKLKPDERVATELLEPKSPSRRQASGNRIWFRSISKIGSAQKPVTPSGVWKLLPHSAECDTPPRRGLGLGVGGRSVAAQQMRESGPHAKNGDGQAGHDGRDLPRRAGHSRLGKQVIGDLSRHAEDQYGDRGPGANLRVRLLTAEFLVS